MEKQIIFISLCPNSMHSPTNNVFKPLKLSWKEMRGNSYSIPNDIARKTFALLLKEAFDKSATRDVIN